MLVSEFDYALPPELIAQHPTAERDASRLMLVNRRTTEIRHAQFAEILEILEPSDALIVNNTKVIPARLFGKKRQTGGKIEIFLLRPVREQIWDVLIGGKAQPGAIVEFGGGMLSCRVLEKDASGKGVVEFAPCGDLKARLNELGAIPLPPYIKRDGGASESDRTRYQTVYASRDGAVAAPTAGLHFSEALLDAIRRKGIDMIPVTLHVGIGTFHPVKVERVEDHQIHAEWYEITENAAEKISAAMTQRRRIITVGTTSARVVEAVHRQYGRIQAGSGWADIFIYPEFAFQVTQALITNFHLPKSSLLMLVSAFGGMELIRKAYQEAIARQYRFYSYGDAMLIY